MEMEIPEEQIHVETGSSDNNFEISFYEASYSFITKSQSKKNKKPIGIRGRRAQIPTQLIENMISDEDDDDLVEDHYDEQEINFDTPDNDNTYKDIDMSNNQPIDFSIGFMWIILWVLKFQERFRMSDVSTNTLIKFLRYLLLLQDAVTYASFPTSLAKAREVLGVCAHMSSMQHVRNVVSYTMLPM